MATALKTVTKQISPDILNGLGESWKHDVRSSIVDTIFNTMLKTDLTTDHPEAFIGSPGTTVEAYAGFFTRPLWLRGLHTNHRSTKEVQGLIARHLKITQMIQESIDPDVNIAFRIEIKFVENPRAALITIGPSENIANAEDYRDFSIFCKIHILRWTTILIKAKVPVVGVSM